ncbi:MAG: serine/threonine protein kinase, partial [Polaromonas sp.]|nr:serine/threonine protein kinase [Gemmatimonadaceae bacterium]
MTTPPVTQAAELAAIRRAIGARYTLERELGRGGMGTVYLARDVKLDRPVALKVLPSEFASQVALRDRFLAETRTAASFSHPNIVPVYAVEESDDLLAYAMGFIEGETLAERVARTGPMPVRDVVRMLQDTGYALAYAHGRGVVHRDIKPDNIMLERATGRALVMDFGISRSISHAVPAANLTRVGEVVGTPEYMSPEQAAGDVVDGRSDLYSLGLTAHFAATGRTVMTGESTQKILVKQLTEAVPSIAVARSDFPAALAAAIDQCVQKDPADRFATAEALVDAIDAAQLAEPDIPVPIRLFAGEVGTLSMVAVGILLYSWLFAHSSQGSSVDTLLPIFALLAVLFTRALTTLSEARRLAIAGFSVDEVMAGFERVMHERAQRREELRADSDTRRLRRLAIRWGSVGLVVSVAMVVQALRLRVRIDPRHYISGTVAVALIFGGAALMGTSVVLLMKSPFRMPPGERLFRALWLGPFGRAFIRFGTRKVKARPATSRPLPSVRTATVGPVDAAP